MKSRLSSAIVLTNGRQNRHGFITHGLHNGVGSGRILLYKLTSWVGLCQIAVKFFFRNSYSKALDETASMTVSDREFEFKTMLLLHHKFGIYDEVYSPHRQDTTNNDKQTDRQTDRQTDTIKPCDKETYEADLLVNGRNVCSQKSVILTIHH